jgi:hypothetical protein
VSNEVIDQVFNHKEKSRVRRTYNRYAFAAEKTAALTRWDRRVREIVKGETSNKVVQLHASRQASSELLGGPFGLPSLARMTPVPARLSRSVTGRSAKTRARPRARQRCCSLTGLPKSVRPAHCAPRSHVRVDRGIRSPFWIAFKRAAERSRKILEKVRKLSAGGHARPSSSAATLRPRRPACGASRPAARS